MGFHILCNFLLKKDPRTMQACLAHKKLDYLIWLPYVMKFSKGQLGSLPSQKGLYSPNLHLSFTRNTNFVKKNWSEGWSGSLGSQTNGFTKLMFDLHLPYSFLLKTTGLKWHTIYFRRTDPRGMSLLCLKKWLDSLSLYLIHLCNAIIAKKQIRGQICLLCSKKRIGFT